MAQLSPTAPTSEAAPVAGAKKAEALGMKKLDQISAVVLLLVSGFVIQQSMGMPQQAEFGPDYGFFPFWLGLLLAVLSIALFVDAWRRPAAKDEPWPFPARKALLNIVLMMAALAGYAFLLETLGYLLTTLLFVGFLMGVVQRDKLRTTVITTLAVTAFLYLVFQILLEINLPKGPFGF